MNGIEQVNRIIGCSSKNLEDNVFLMHCINVGQGDCFIIQSPNFICLIDGYFYGIHANNLQLFYNYCKSFGITEIDYVIITHAHYDHFNGILEIIKHYHVKKTYVSPFISGSILNSKKYEYNKILYSDNNHTISNPDVVFIDNMNSFIVLSDKPGNVLKLNIQPMPQEIKDYIYQKNKLKFDTEGTPYVEIEGNNSLVNCSSLFIEITNDKFRLLNCGDLEEECWNIYVNSYPTLISNCDFLKFSHHGSKNGLPTEIRNTQGDIIYSLKPNAILITNGPPGRKHHFPDEKTVERIGKMVKDRVTELPIFYMGDKSKMNIEKNRWEPDGGFIFAFKFDDLKNSPHIYAMEIQNLEIKDLGMNEIYDTFLEAI